MKHLRLTVAGLITAAIALPVAPAMAADTTLEAESMVVSPAGAGSTYSDSSASGGTALGLWTNSSASTNLSLPASSSVVVRAKGQSCRGAPSMTVSIDGTTISTTTVSATSWTDYTTATTIPAGSHGLSIAFTNDYRRSKGSKGCDRNLLLDKVTVAAGNPTTTPPPPPPPSPSGGFIYRDGDKLMLNGAPYRFVGVNNYDLTGCHTGKPVAESDADAFFAQLPPHSMTRVWAFEEQGIDGVAQTVRLAEKYGQKLTLAFADGAGYCSAPNFDGDWYQSGFRGKYFAWIAKLTTAFKDSPAVGVWEIMNEPGSRMANGGNPNVTASIMKQFYDTTAAYIKQNDPSHLVSTGALAPWQTFQQDVAGYANAHSGPNIDLVSVHEYDYPYNSSRTIISHWFDVAHLAAQSIGKPVYVGETGISLTTGCMSAAERADALHQKFDAYLANGGSGVLYWVALGPPNNPGTVCNSQYGNRDPMLGGAIMNMIATYTGV